MNSEALQMVATIAVTGLILLGLALCLVLYRVWSTVDRASGEALQHAATAEQWRERALAQERELIRLRQSGYHGAYPVRRPTDHHTTAEIPRVDDRPASHRARNARPTGDRDAT